MNSLLFFILTITLLSVLNAQITIQDCGAPTDPLQLLEFNYTPSNFINIDENFTISIIYSLTQTLNTGTVQATLWYTDFNGDPLIPTVDFNLCEIASQIKCPLASGNHTFKSGRQFPEFPLGQYKLRIVVVNENTVRQACKDIFFSVNNGTTPVSRCEFLSYYNADGSLPEIHYQNQPIFSRKVGDWLQVGTLGPYSTGNWANGTFSKFDASPDNLINAEMDYQNYIWGINCTLNKITNTSSNINFNYIGDFWVGNPSSDLISWDNYFLKGSINFVSSYSLTTQTLVDITGDIDVEPIVHVPPVWHVIIGFGDKNPGSISFSSQYNAWSVSAQKIVCQCPIDVCGVCGGDGSTCAPSTSASSNTGVIVTSIVVPIVVITGVILAIVFIRKRKQKKNLRDSIFSQYGTTDTWQNIDTQVN
ncbi:phosphatidylglycerol/phosphatidylinositol transfer protein -related [Anaeramoeba ignava]|uniref:Phosphatidylglycerol/phosphatidylinositol transfer protein -related n=1 Tax=Anaeramoeba ignava TaxID=1746090 RepID=A0A9Q0RED7_ANAIG|nr:phosphatidylglycerol/phosphatidylinositol transfer protein -related [Anaeramoeba ignava]|eukprot:Anaeramoba_ignava/a227658_99.p1 GENE.a227658_99~~a227658_99.p1  ORF type:complete len:444 (+),score=112.46 a227658_99:76-1332(+)